MLLKSLLLLVCAMMASAQTVPATFVSGALAGITNNNGTNTAVGTQSATLNTPCPTKRTVSHSHLRCQRKRHSGKDILRKQWNYIYSQTLH